MVLAAVAPMHGPGVAIALLGGIVALRHGGPVRLHATSSAWKASLPGLGEEVVSRYALLGIVWLLLHPSWGRQAPWLAGIVALLVHTFAHNGERLLADPLMYVPFGTFLALA